MIAPHVLGVADEEAASPENKKKAAGLPAAPQEFNYGEHLELMADPGVRNSNRANGSVDAPQ